MSSPDNEVVNSNNSIKELSELVSPSSKTFHYVSLPKVVLKRIDDQIPSHINTGRPHVMKKPIKKPTKPVFSQKLIRRNSPRINSLPEKRPIKLTNKGEDTLHIINLRGNSARKFIVENKVIAKSNGDLTKHNQNMLKNSKIIHKPLPTVRSKMEINKPNIPDKKLISKSVIPLGKKGNATGGVQVNKNIQNKQREVPAHPSNKNIQNKQIEVPAHPYGMRHKVNTEKQNTGAVQINKNLQNKLREAISHPYGMKHNTNTEKVALPTQNKTPMSKEIHIKESLSNFVNMNTQGSSPAKRKLPEEHYHDNKVQKVMHKSPDIVNTENAGINKMSSFVSNTKVPPDRKTAKVIPLAKARKSITLPKPDVKVTQVKSSGQESKDADNLEAVILLSKLVGMPISADKMEVVLRRDSEKKQISERIPPSAPPKKQISERIPPSAPPSSKKQGVPVVSNLSRLLSDSLKPSTSEMRSTTTTKTTVTTSTTSMTVPTPKSDPGSIQKPTTTSDPVHTKECVSASDPVCPKKPAVASDPVRPKKPTSASDPVCVKEPTSASDPVRIQKTTSASDPTSSSSSTTQPVNVKNSVPVEVVSDGAQQQSSSQNVSAAEDNKTIYDVMADVSVMYPAWNLHILEDTNTFCIAYIARNNSGVPAIVKCIELDEQFNAKVYIHQYHCKQFDGQYNDEESIVSLVSKVNTLKA